MNQESPYIFHAADVSYFSGKVRPALWHKSLWFREVIPDYEQIRERTGLAFIPVLMTPEGEGWQDTSTILDRLEERHPDPPLYPKTPVQRIIAYLIELYSDEVALLPAMHYRWAFDRSVRKARIDFGFSSGRADLGNRFADRMSGSLPLLGVTKESGPAIEAHLAELLEVLCRHFDEHRFLLGDAMSLADCALLGPFYGHLFRDAVPQELLYETAFRVCCWIERMNRPPTDQTNWLADDALAPTLREALGVMADGVGMLEAALVAIEDWADEHAADGTPPRAIGTAESQYRGASLRCGARPYTLWMLQRTLDAYRALSLGERAQVDAVISGTGWEPILALAPRHRLTKRGNDLAWDLDGASK
jgi:glutathione S-transferase